MGVHPLLFCLLLLCALVHVRSQEVVFDVDASISIEEEQPVGSTVVDIDVNYYDSLNIFREESYGSYSFVTGQDDSYSYFNISPSNGIITNAAVLDIDGSNPKLTYPVTVNFTASDGYTDTFDIIIYVNDINDNTPTFNQTEYAVTVPESAAIGYEVFKAVASDPDQVASELQIDEVNMDIIGIVYTISNGRALYEVIGGNEKGQFVIEPETGVVTVAVESSLDVDELDFYNLTILAEDGGGLTNTTNLLITITDSNDNPPVILYPESFTINISEATPSGLVIVDYINATDNDSGMNAEIQFSISDGDVTNSFVIDEETGELVLSGKLDRETKNPLVLVIAATDQGIPPLQGTFSITINLLDVNDEPPEFTESLYSFEIKENPKVGSTVGMVQANDEDEGNNGIVTYSLKEISSHFEIDNSTGIITTVNADLDREEQAEYILIVEAVDNPTNKSLVLNSTSMVNISLTDVNDNNPQWSNSEYSVGILETESPGYELTVLQATDKDSGTNSELKYEFFNNNDMTFAIDSETGFVSLNEDIDFSTKSEYTYLVRASDKASSPRDALTTLNILVHTPNKNPPVFAITEHNLTLPENTAIGTIVLNVTAIDKDSGLIGELHYRIAASSAFNGSGSFDVNEDTGGVYISEELDYDYSDKKHIFFQVEAYDGGFPEPFTAHTNVTIYLTNSNDEAPKIIIPAMNTPTILENKEPDVMFADLKPFTVDEDPGDGGLFDFTLIKVYGDDYENDSFELTPDGLLISLRTFDREENPQGFILSIVTTDLGLESNSLINNVTVLIGDENDQAPFFESNASVQVYEFRLPGELVLAEYVATDYDIDENAELKYAIVDGDTTDSFAINSNGTITTTRPLDKNDKRYYTLTILAMDKGLLPLYGYGEVSIEVLDANDNAPQFDEPLIAMFNENDGPGTVFYQLNATDSDEGTNSHIVYYLSEESIKNMTIYNNVTNTTVVRFAVDKHSGNVSIQDTFNREVESEFELTIVAIDMGTVPEMLNTSVLLTVLVEDFNDNTPAFVNESYSFYATENEDIGTSLGQVFAKDDDASYPNNEIVFSITSTWGDSNVTVDEDTGVLYVNGTVDWEETPVIDMTVYATDLGSPSYSSTVNLTVMIKDVNDRAPEWNTVSLNLTIYENQPPGSSAGYIEAIDPDSTGNNSLVYYIIAIDFTSNSFELNRTSGEISSLVTFDRETQDLFDLVVVALDNGIPQMYSSAEVFIEILDDNDHDPYFKQAEYVTTISENTPNQTVIIQLSAQDNDIGTNALFAYSVSSPEYSQFFDIIEATGELYVNTILDYENITYFEFEVMVTDDGRPKRNGTAIVQITISNYNDEPPVFTEQEYTATIIENLAVGSNILRIQTSDVDSEITTYSLEESFVSAFFEIDPFIGMLYTVDFIDREVLGSNIEVTVIANNSAESVNPLSSLATVSITILDLNDQTPLFEPYVIVSVQEDTTIGSVVHTLTADDGDEGMNGTIVYEIVSGNNGNLFSMNQMNGNITLLSKFDYEGQRYHYVGVNATDQGINPLHGYTTIVFQVMDANDNPPIFAAPKYITTTYYVAAIGNEVLTVSASDKDTGANAAVEYNIVNGNNEGLFDISTSNGRISIKKSLVAFANSLINMTVEANDGKYNDTTIVNIQIRGSTTPYFDSPTYKLSISEGHSDSNAIFDLYDKVPDAVPSTVFHIVAGNDDGIFSLEIDGALTVDDGSKLDFEVKLLYQLSVSVDGNSYAIVNIEIEDVNEYSPVFSSLQSFYAPVYETIERKASFFLVLAEDRDGSSPPNTISYSISSGNEENIFSLNSGTGELSFNKLLDYDEDEHIYILNITAENKDSDPYFSTSHLVTAELLNGNKHAPVFQKNIYSAYLSEDIDQGTPIDVVVAALDNDENQKATVTYTLLGNHRHYDFEINGVTGNITVGPGRLDYEREEIYSLMAVATDNGIPQKTSTALVLVTVIDINDNSPVWGQQQYRVNIMENIVVGTSIIDVLATDSDQIDYYFSIDDQLVFNNKNGHVTYAITAGDPKSQFSIMEDTFDPDVLNIPSTVRVVFALDREDIHDYNLTLTATDGGPNGGRSTNVFLYVSLIDKNDVTPTFNSSSLSVDISEDFEIGSLITQVLAVDNDLLENSVITYNISYGNINSTFSINSTTAEIFLEGELDREVLSTYILGIEAVDNGEIQLTGRTVLQINVLDKNEFAPVFTDSQYTASVDENTPFQYVILEVLATDKDSGINAKVVYDISSGNDEGVFMINSSDGRVLINDHVDFESTTVYFLTVTASDSAPLLNRLSSEVNVTITINDVNDNFPHLDEDTYEASIPEDAEPMTEITQVSATDLDSGLNAQIQYSLDFGGDEEAAGNFLIDEATGYINLTGKITLDYEKRHVYFIYVIATDQGSPSLSTNVPLNISIEDVNDNVPLFSQDLYNGSIIENVPAGQSILMVESSDLDSNENGAVRYSVLDVVSTKNDCLAQCPTAEKTCNRVFKSDIPANSSLFSIDNATGVLYSTMAFDRETIEEYVVVLLVSDSSIDEQQLSSTACVSVTIEDANDEQPMFLSLPYTASVSEEQPPNIAVSSITAVDHDIGLNAAIEYELESNADTFTINPNSGEIYTLVTLDREKVETYNISVIAIDKGTMRNTATASVYVQVLDINDSPPYFLNTEYNVSIAEDTSTNTTIFTATTSDDDINENSKVLYSLYSVTPEPHFGINATTGIIFSTASLDRETTSNYAITILAIDGGSPPLSSNISIQIYIEDINDNAPVFTLDEYQVIITEESPQLEPILIVGATDKDIGSNSIVQFSINNAFNRFSINKTTGEIYVEELLDSEMEQSVNFTVVAENAYGLPYLSTSQVVVINVTDINDHAPVFMYTQYAIEVSESAPVGSSILQVVAKDQDYTFDNRNLSYSFVNTTNATPFTIDSNTGVIEVIQELDRDISSNAYTLSVFVEDNGHPKSFSDMTTVIITLTDVNDNPPVFLSSNYSFELYENQPLGESVGTVYATDADIQNITYTLSLYDEDSDKFLIDKTSGEIISNFTFDREEQDFYIITVIAVDDEINGTSSEVTVEVTILDVNDNEPSFTNDTYTINFAENITIDTLLTTVTAPDVDLEENSVAVYSIAEGTSSSFFYVNASSGSIYLNQTLDREANDTITVTIVATDMLDSQLTSMALLLLHVEDVNDNIPQFEKSLYTATLSENDENGTEILMVSASDNDIEENAHLSFSLADDFSHVFSINETSGLITLIGPLDYESHVNYTIPIYVSDNGFPSLQSSTELFITIRDINDNSPYFEQQSYHVSVAENSILETFIFQVPAIDIDDGVNAVLQYTILSGNIRFYFNLDESMGVVSVADYIDFEIEPSFMLEIQVVDLGVPQFTASTTLNITIEDVNDHYPQFSDDVIIISVSEDTSIGTIIFNISVTDDDSGSNAEITYVIDSGNHGDVFGIDDNTGSIYTNGSLDFEERQSYSLTIVASDNGIPSLSRMAQVIISITNINEDAPVLYLATYYLNVSESTAIGTTLAHLSAYDKDRDTALVTYNITSSTSPAFAVTSVGELYVYSSLSVGSFIVVVAVSDGINTNSISIEVNVHPQSYTGPRFKLPTYLFDISEAEDISTSIGNVSLTSDVTSVYFISTESDFTSEVESFYINSAGEMHLVKQLDREKLEYYVLNVRAVHDSHEVYTVVTVNVLDINDNPPLFDNNEYDLTLSEGTPTDTTVLSFIYVHDADSPGTNSDISLALDEGSGYFSIDSVTKSLVLSNSLDRETVDSIIVVVNASNPKAEIFQQSMATVYITVTDENDNNPEFDQVVYTASIFETTPIGDEVIQVIANDADVGINGDLVFSITYQSSPDSFTINSTDGAIYTSREFGEDIGNTISISLLVSDQGIPAPRTDTTLLFVSVVKQNLHSPEFNKPNGYTVAIEETIAIGATVVELTATDEDDDSVSYEIVSEVPFTISPFSGMIKTSSELDYLVQQSYTFIVTATDDGSPVRTESTVVNVSITDVNNHSPQFDSTMYEASIIENVPEGTLVTQITASDLDATSIVYVITVNFEEKGTSLFKINGSTGEIYTNALINRETVSQVELLVSAIDFGYSVQRSTSTQVIITIEDINDENPIFSQPEYRVDVIRLSPTDYFVLNVIAYDTDTTGREIEYEIVFQTVEDLFKINSSTGVISASNIIPEDVQNDTVLVVSAFDGNQTSNVTVKIRAVTNGTFCKDGFCTTVVERSVSCNYIIPSFPICNTFCESGLFLSPKEWLCMKHYCTDSTLVPCLAIEQCLKADKACNGVCPQGQSVCPTTDTCYLDSKTTLCDTNTCLVGQTLKQSSDGLRSCALSTSLSLIGQSCTQDGLIYCEEIDKCSNLTAPHLCKLCPIGEIVCNDTKVCVNNTKYCCGNEGYYCGALSTCLTYGEVCQLPNIAPNATTQLLYYGEIGSMSFDSKSVAKGVMIGLLLGNGDTLGTDSQGEEIGIAIVEIADTNSSHGEWQYANCLGSMDECRVCSNVSEWITIDLIVTESSALFVPNTACLRFWRRSVYLEGAVWMRVKAWDGNLDGYISASKEIVRFQEPFVDNTVPFTLTSSVSEMSMLLSALLLPLNALPVVLESDPHLTSISENVKLHSNTGDSIQDIVKSVLVVYQPELTVGTIDGFPEVDDNGNLMNYEELLPASTRETYYSEIEKVNPTRSNRLGTYQKPGIAVQLYSSDSGDGEWQVSLNGDTQLYVYLSDIVGNSKDVLLLNTTSSIRYIPNHYFNGIAMLSMYPWDGVIPDSAIKHNIHGFIGHTANLKELLPSGVNNATSLHVSVTQVEQLPLITEQIVLMSPIPYNMRFTYPSLFTTTILKEYSTLSMEKDHVENILHLVLGDPVTVYHIFPATNSRTYITFEVMNNETDIVDIQEDILSNQQILNSFLPVAELSQDAKYGSGVECTNDNSGEVTGDYVNNLVSQIATDSDGDFMGIAVVGVVAGDGIWQYSRGTWSKENNTNSSGIWLNFPSSISEASSLLLHGNDKIRFLPKALYYWQSSSNPPMLTVKAWDNSLGSAFQDELSRMNINTDPYTDTLQSIHRPVGRFSSTTTTILASRLGCDGKINSAKVHDACCVCGGSGKGCNGCDNVLDSNKLLDSCGECGGLDSDCLGCDVIPFSFLSMGSCSECISALNVVLPSAEVVYPSESFKDCTGTCFGNALEDSCVVCSGGTTDHDYNQDMDCFGLCFGENVLDECGYCTGPDTGIDYNDHLDCTGVCGGPFRTDSCDNCQLPDNSGAVKEYADCNGTCYGSAELDSCGICHGGLTGLVAGTTLDQCGVCNGNDTCYGCNGALNSGMYVDNCGVCGGNDCGCQHVVKAIPNRGPSTGGTNVAILGSGFFLNGSYYDPSLTYCNASMTLDGGKSVSATCRFVFQNEEAFGNAFIINQNTIICQTPQVSNEGDTFTLSIRIENGPYTPPIPFTFEKYEDILISSFNPSEGPLNSDNLITFTGKSFINTGVQSCLVQGLLSCEINAAVDSNSYHVISAVFVSESKIICKLPVSKKSCQVSVYLSLDGQQSGIIETTMKTFTYAFSSPEATTVHFTNNLSALVIEFDRAISVIGSSEITCSSVFDDKTLQLLSLNASCFLSTVEQKSLNVLLSTESSVHVGSPISFKKGAVTTKGVDFSFAVSSTSYVEESLLPAVVLEGPSMIPFCGQLKFSVINSFFEGYDDFQYKWLVYTLNSSIAGTKEIVDYLNGLPSTASEITISSSLFQTSTSYIIQVVVTNALGLSSIVNKEMTKETSASLQVSISSVNSQLLYPEQDILLNAKIVNEECTNLNSNFKFSWQVYKLIDERRLTYELHSTSGLIVNNPLLYIPSRYLSLHSSYMITTMATTTDNAHSSSKSVHIAIRAEKCNARIHGGNRTMSTEQLLLLDATVSQESNKGYSRYIWQCSVIGSRIPCYDTSVTMPLTPIKLPFESQVSLPLSRLAPGVDYKFVLILEDRDCTSMATTVVSVASNVSSEISLQILTPPMYVLPPHKVVIEGLVYTNKPVTLTWECLKLQDHSYLDLGVDAITLSSTTYNALTESDITTSNDFVTTGQASTVNLVFRPGVLIGDLPYIFQLTAVDNNNDVVTTSKVIVTPNLPPRIHRFEVSPSSGLELDTKFMLHVERVTENFEEYPLYYQYGIIENDNVYWLTGITPERAIFTHLPSGNPKTVLVRVYDSHGGYSDRTAEVLVNDNSAIDHSKFMNVLESNLHSNKDWVGTLSSLVSALISADENEVTASFTSSAVSISLNIFKDYIPSTKAHATAELSTIKLLVEKLPGMNFEGKISMLDVILKAFSIFDGLVSENFDVPSGLVDSSFSLLRSNRYNRSSFFEAIDNSIIKSTIETSFVLTADWNPEYALKERDIRLKVHHILCKQTLLGEAATSIQSSSHSLYFFKGIPVGTIQTPFSSAFLKLENKLVDISKNKACSNSYTACSGVCIQLASHENDYFSLSGDNTLSLTSDSRDLIASNIEGSDPENIQLLSDILSMDLSLPTRDELWILNNLDSNIEVYFPVTLNILNSSIPLCMFRDSTSNAIGKWNVDTFNFPTVENVDGKDHFLCEFNHLAEFALGLLPPPIITLPPSSTPVFFSSPVDSPSPIPYIVSSSSPSPTLLTHPTSDNTQAIVGGTVSVFLVLIITVVILMMFIVVWWNKRARRTKVMPVVKSISEDEVSQKTLIVEEKSKPLTPEQTNKMDLGVIQLMKNGERVVLGSMNVLMSTRLRELRNLLTENFQKLKTTAFYLCTKELSDIDPATEQQQFVSLVYSNIVYVREVSVNNENKQKQFCVCNKVAQFECSTCSQRGYCSKECQEQDWEAKHNKECRRLSERRSRTDILLHRQLSTTSNEERDGGPKSPRQSVGSPVDWKGFLNQSRSYQHPHMISPQTTTSTLPPISSQPTPKVTSSPEEVLRERLDTTEQTLIPPIRKLPPPSTLPRLTSMANRKSVGQLASKTPMQQVRSTLSPITSHTNQGVRPVAMGLQHSMHSMTPLHGVNTPSLLQAGGYDHEQPQPWQLAQSYAQQTRVNQPQEYQTPLFTRPSLSSLQSTPRPLLNRNISIASVQSSDISFLKPNVRQDPVLEESENESSSSHSDSDKDEHEESERVPSSRPPSLAVRRRTSSKLRSRADANQYSSDSTDTSTDSEDDS